MSTDAETWWPLLSGAAQEWLTEHNGEPVPPDVRAELAAVGGPTDDTLPDEVVDWVEAVANGEQAPPSA